MAHALSLPRRESSRRLHRFAPPVPARSAAWAAVWPRPAVFSGPSLGEGWHSSQSPSGPESRPIVHRPTRTLDTLAILKGGDHGLWHDARRANKKTKRTQFLATALQSMSCSLFSSPWRRAGLSFGPDLRPFPAPRWAKDGTAASLLPGPSRGQSSIAQRGRLTRSLF